MADQINKLIEISTRMAALIEPIENAQTVSARWVLSMTVVGENMTEAERYEVYAAEMELMGEFPEACIDFHLRDSNDGGV